MKRVLFNLTVLLLIVLIIRVGYLATTMSPEDALRTESTSSPLPGMQVHPPSHTRADSLSTDSLQLYSQRQDASQGAFWFGIR